MKINILNIKNLIFSDLEQNQNFLSKFDLAKIILWLNLIFDFDKKLKT